MWTCDYIHTLRAYGTSSHLLNNCQIYNALRLNRGLLGVLCDLLWSDPDKNVDGWGSNDRGLSFTFGSDVVTQFLKIHDLELIVRGHQVSIIA